MKTNSHSVRFIKDSAIAKLIKVDGRLPETQCQFALEIFFMTWLTAAAYSGILILVASFVLWMNPVMLADLLMQAGAGSGSTTLMIFSIILFMLMMFFCIILTISLLTLATIATVATGNFIIKISSVEIATPLILKRLYAKLCKPMVYEDA